MKDISRFYKIASEASHSYAESDEKLNTLAQFGKDFAELVKGEKVDLEESISESIAFAMNGVFKQLGAGIDPRQINKEHVLTDMKLSCELKKAEEQLFDGIPVIDGNVVDNAIKAIKANEVSPTEATSMLRTINTWSRITENQRKLSDLTLRQNPNGISSTLLH